MTASKSRSWWGVFVSLLASIALAIAMIAVPAPKAEAQAVGLGDQVRVTGASPGTVSIKYPGSDTFTSQAVHDFRFESGGKTYYAYCIEALVTVDGQVGGEDNVLGRLWQS